MIRDALKLSDTLQTLACLQTVSYPVLVNATKVRLRRRLCKLVLVDLYSSTACSNHFKYRRSALFSSKLKKRSTVVP